jgi:hypothetical protein
MRFIGYFLFTVMLAGISACSQPYGKEYKLDDKHNVYYKGEGVDEALAIKLATYLKQHKYFHDSLNCTVQLIKTKDSFSLNFVVDETRLTTGYENRFLAISSLISDSVLNKAPVSIQLTNDKLEPFKNLGSAKPVSDSLQ